MDITRGNVPIIIILAAFVFFAMPAACAEEDIREHIFIEVEVPSEARVSEEVPVQVRFYTDWLDVEDLKVWDGPSDAYIAGDFVTGGTEMAVRGGTKYAVLLFSKKLVFQSAGDHDYGPVKASCVVTKPKAQLLNDNREFYDEYLGRRKSRGLAIESETYSIHVLQALQTEMPPEEEAVEPEEAVKEEGKKLPLEMIGIKISPGKLEAPDPFFYRSRILLYAELLPLIALLASVLVERRLRKLRGDTPYTRWLRASRAAEKDVKKARALMKRKDNKRFYEQVFRAMQRYLGVRFSVLPEGITEELVEARVAAALGNDDLTGAIKGIFHQCYLARYSPFKEGGEEMVNTLDELDSVLERLNSIKEI